MIRVALYSEKDQTEYEIEFADNEALKAYIDEVGGLFVQHITFIQDQ